LATKGFTDETLRIFVTRKKNSYCRAMSSSPIDSSRF
jgi:hypothetical protein